MEGRYYEIFEVHFVLLNHFKGLYRINIPYFLYNSFDIYIRKNRGGMLIYQGLIKILMDYERTSARRVRPLV